MDLFTNQNLTCQVPLAKLKPWQKHETMPGAELFLDKGLLYSLTNKVENGLQNISQGHVLRQIVSTSFILPEELDMFKSAWEKQVSVKAIDNIWIAKPINNAAGRSTGIKFISNQTQFHELLNSLLKGPNPKQRYLVQKYLRNPFLANGQKTELRKQIIITSVFPPCLFNHNKYRKLCIWNGIPNYTLDANTFHDNGMHTRYYDHCKGYSHASLQGFYSTYLKNDQNLVYKIDLDEIINAILITIQNDKLWLNSIKTEGMFNTYSVFTKFDFDFLLDVNYNLYLNEVNYPGTKTRNLVAGFNLVGFHLPTLNSTQRNLLSTCLSPKHPEEFTFNEKIYSVEITTNDKLKQSYVVDKLKAIRNLDLPSWDSLVEGIISSLTAADIRFLLLTFDEVERTNKRYKRILPIEPELPCIDFDSAKQRLNYYAMLSLDNKESRVLYYYVLYEAWMWKYQTKIKAIAQLVKLAEKKYHLM